MSRKIVRCINCEIRLTRINRRRLFGESERLVDTIRLWISPREITKTDFICQACRDLANDASDCEVAPERQFGHRNVCVGCGRSILRSRSHVALRPDWKDEERQIADIISQWTHNRQLTPTDKVCMPCWLRAQRTLRCNTNTRRAKRHRGTPLHSDASDDISFTLQSVKTEDPCANWELQLMPDENTHSLSPESGAQSHSAASDDTSFTEVNTLRNVKTENCSVTWKLQVMPDENRSRLSPESGAQNHSSSSSSDDRCFTEASTLQSVKTEDTTVHWELQLMPDENNHCVSTESEHALQRSSASDDLSFTRANIPLNVKTEESCVNCELQLLPHENRHCLSSESEHLVRIIKLWKYPKNIMDSDYICQACWERANQQVKSKLKAEDSSVQQEGKRKIPRQQNITLPKLRRAPDTSRHCLFSGCKNAERYHIHDAVRRRVLSEYHFYIPRDTRICGYHMERNIYQELYTSEHSLSSFKPNHIEDMVSLQAQPANVLNFEDIRSFPEHIAQYFLGISLHQYQLIMNETKSLQEMHRGSFALTALLCKLKTRDSGDRLASLFQIPRRTVETLINKAREILVREYVPQHPEPDLGVLGALRKDYTSTSEK